MFGVSDVTSALDTTSQMLAGGTNTPNAATTGTATFVRGIHIDTDDPETGGSAAPNLLNERDLNHLLEFIHFGNVHTSYSNFFPHPVYTDNEQDDAIAKGSRPRAIQFRAALLREAVLLSLFMESTQTVLQERDNSKGNLADPTTLASGGAAGALGSAMDTLGSLTGESGGGSGQTTSGDLNALVQKVADAVEPLLAESITYDNTHQAGRDMHQARADYRELLNKISTEAPAAAPGGGLLGDLGKVTGLTSAAGPVGQVITFAQGVAFKPQDIKVKFFAKVAAQQERQIEIACHAMTLQAIADGLNPVLPVWFGDPDAKATDAAFTNLPDSPLKPVDKSNLLNPIINPVANPVTDARNKAAGAANDAKSFFENPTPPTPPPGTDFLDQAFDVPKPAKDKKEPIPMEMGALAVRAFIEALGVKPPQLNSFCEGVIGTVFAITLDFIHGTYEALLARSPDEDITADSLYVAARERLQIVSRLLSLASEKVKFIQDAQSLNPGLNDYHIGVGQLIGKEAKNVDEMIANTVKPLMDKALEDAMAGLADKLNLARMDGNSNECLTMEWYLGRLPWLQATLFCDLFFPFWNALLQCVMNVVDPAAASVIKSIVGAANSVKSKLDTARDDIAKAQALKQAADNTITEAGQGVNMLNPSSVAGLGKGYGSALGATANKTSAPDAVDRGAFAPPVTNRSVTGKGEEVPKSPMYDQVMPEHKWDGADDPDAEPKQAADSNAAETKTP